MPDAAWHCDEVDDAPTGMYDRLEAGYRHQWENVAGIVYAELTELVELAA